VHVPSFFEEFDTLRDKGNSSSFCFDIAYPTILATEQDWIGRVNFSFPIARISSLTFT
jgi:hypothetical protein